MTQKLFLFKVSPYIIEKKNHLFVYNWSSRGHENKITKPWNINIRNYSFSNRVVYFWNGLPQVADSLGTFNRGLDSYMDSQSGYHIIS